jgi:hypothetical protein
MRLTLSALVFLLMLTNWVLAAEDELAEEVSQVEAVEGQTADDKAADSAESAATEEDTKEEGKYQPGAEKKVFVYENGCPQGYATDEEWEFYEVECKDIVQGNWDLMREVSCACSEGGLTLGAAVRSASNDPQVEITGPSPEGATARGGWRRKTNGRGDWQELYFDFANSDSYSTDYKRETLRSNWDLSHFTRNGNVLGLRSDDDAVPTSHTWDSGTRDRSMTDLSFRNGSAEGGSWRVNLRHYDTEIGAIAPPQPDDSRLTRFEVEGRMVECRTTLEGAAFAGSYRGRRALMDNDFSGVRFDGSRWLGDRVELQADGTLTRIDAAVQDASATRSNYSAQLGWDMTCDLRLTAYARGYSDDSNISAGSTLRNYSDTGARLDYRPDGDTSLSASLTNRDISTERLELESIDILPFQSQFDPMPTREDLAGLRTSYKPSGRLFDIEARHRWNCRFYTGAALHTQDFDDLPEAAPFLNTNLLPSPFADHRAQANLHAAYELCNLGNVTFRAGTDHRSNSARGSSFERNQYTMGYSTSLCEDAQLGLGVTRQATSIDTGNPEPENNWDGSGWNYALNLSGSSESDCMRYVISLNHAVSDEHAGGDLDSLGLELSFDSPWRVSAWWRQFDDFLGGRNANDLGVQVGYRIDL